MPSITLQHISTFRAWMQNHRLQAFIVPTTDPHASEYTPPYYASRQWLTGFSGSAGTAVITIADSALWTDSRYFLAAEQELDGTGIQLMKEGIPGTPSIIQWLKETLNKGDRVGFDAHVNSHRLAEQLSRELSPFGIETCPCQDPFESLWTDRPSLPQQPITIHPIDYAGESSHSKLLRLRQLLKKHNASHILVSALDDIAWLLNLRGNDVECTPVFMAYCIIDEHTTLLCIDEQRLEPSVRQYLKQEGVSTVPYQEVTRILSQIPADATILLSENINEAIYSCLSAHILTGVSPIAAMKAIKNPTEIAGFRNAMERDGVALVKFLRWLLPAVEKGGQTEISVSRHLEQLRAAHPLYRGESFSSISAYKEHGAIVHYEATPETDAPLQPQGLLLMDTGAHYADGTTDITRTIALGEPTPHEKHIYTLVLKGHIALSRCRFPIGVSGTQLDMAARYAMWQEGLNYGHGTGHGVGSFLCVHEGPHQIRMNYIPAPITPGIIVTDEPGLYLKGEFGVRIENMLLCVPSLETAFGSFASFEPLTLCPIDLRPVDMSLLTHEEKEWINHYHSNVFHRLSPLLEDPEDKKWLEKATACIH